MRIATKLAVNIGLFIIFGVAVLAGILLMTSKVEKSISNNHLIEQILEGINELNILTYSYAMFQEERPRTQWEAKYASLKSLMQRVTTEEKPALARMAANHERAKTLFDHLVLKFQNSRGPRSDHDEETERLVSQCIARTQMMRTDAILLRQMSNASLLATVREGGWLLAGILVALLGIAVLTSVLLSRKITGALHTLHKGTEIIRAGNLEYRTGIASNDEIGRLSDSFDYMAESLKETMVSRDALRREVEERKRAEEALKKAHGELEVRVLERTAELGRANQELQEEMARREKAEQQLRQAQKMEAIGTLTGGIAHDFNNILGPIVINSEMALSDFSGDPGIRNNLELILKSGIRGRELVKQLLLFGRKSEQKQEIVTLTPLIKETFKLLRSSIPTSIGMKLHIETESDAVYADPSQIQQVIMNLCTNAAYAMRGTTGSIDISLIAVTFGSMDLPEENMQPGTYLVLSVKDTGSGMDEEVRKRIFEPFFTTKPVGEGSGLGLPVAYGIMKSHRGHITVYSEPGRGSIFKVYLPKADAGDSGETEALKPVPMGNERILFVDDEEMILKSVRNMLERLGYRSTALMDGKEALRVFSENPFEFDLVITDQTMPFVAGEDLGKQLMRMRPDIPVILCTGYSDSISSEKAMTMGFRGFIMKPFTVRELAQLVRKVLDQK